MRARLRAGDGVTREKWREGAAPGAVAANFDPRMGNTIKGIRHAVVRIVCSAMDALLEATDPFFALL